MCAIFSRTQENMNLKKEMGDPKKKKKMEILEMKNKIPETKLHWMRSTADQIRYYRRKEQSTLRNSSRHYPIGKKMWIKDL